MGLTPNEVEQHTFRERFRGYHPDEVDAFVERVVASLRDLERERDDMAAAREAAVEEREAALAERDRSLHEAAESEALLRKTLVTAQRTADQTVADANEEADRIRERATAQAERIVADARHQARDVADAIEGLLHVHERVRASIHEVLDEHAAMIEQEGRLPPTAAVIAKLRAIASARPSDDVAQRAEAVTPKGDGSDADGPGVDAIDPPPLRLDPPPHRD